MTIKEKLAGVFPPIMTPFNHDGTLDYGGLAANIERLNATGLRGYMPLGSNGEFRSLTDSESIKVIETIARAKAADKTMMVGTGRESAFATIEFTKRAADAGAEFASVLTPHYYAKQMQDENLIRFFTQVADASPVPGLMYCAPAYAAGVLISTSAVSVLSRHPKIVGMKDTSKEDIAAYVQAADSDNFFVLAGSITKFLRGLTVGGIGGVLSIANYLPDLCAELQRLFEAGKTAEAEALNTRLLSINSRAAGPFGVAGVKAAMNLLGYAGGEPRIPLLPLPEADCAVLKETLASEGLLP
jgi:4-hydroxy-2-oxoglutarate aldolase